MPPNTSAAVAAAAMEAASIVSEMVDIDTPTGAVIVAAAAATAAAAAHEADAAANRPPTQDPTAPSEPSTTVRLSRDRILRALSESEAAAPETRLPRARTQEPLRAQTQPTLAGATTTAAPGDFPAAEQLRPQTSPAELAGLAEEDEFDPVQVAAAAIQRLRRRARTDIAELTVHYHRHDILVVLLSLVIIFAAGRLYASLVTPPSVTFSSHGLTFDHASGWSPEPSPLPPPRLVHDSRRSASRPKTTPCITSR